MLRAIFFDAAGTLIEPRDPVGASYARIARKYSVNASSDAVNAAFRRAFGQAPPLAFGPGREPHELRQLEKRWWRDRVAESFRGLGQFTDFEAYFEELFSFFADPANWRVDDAAFSVLTELQRRGYRLGMISNFDYRLYAILDGLELTRFFASITISSEAGFAKPAPEIFHFALAGCGVGPAQAAHVGDSEHLDIAGAVAAGLKAVWIDPDCPSPLELKDGVVRIARLATLIEVLERAAFP